MIEQSIPMAGSTVSVIRPKVTHYVLVSSQ